MENMLNILKYSKICSNKYKKIHIVYEFYDRHIVYIFTFVNYTHSVEICKDLKIHFVL